MPKPERKIHLNPDLEYSERPVETYYACHGEVERFRENRRTYKTMEYNTFTKNGVLKLTEVELFFLSKYMQTCCCDWLTWLVLN